jgi:YVTN family beta-propeller protein
MLPTKGGRSSLHKKTLLLTPVLALLLITLAAGVALGAGASRQGDLLYACNGNNVTVFNATDMKIVANVNFGNVSPSYIALSPDGTMAYIVSMMDSRVFFLNTTSWHVAHVTTMASPASMPAANGSAIAVTPDGSLIYVGDYQGNVVRAVNASNYTVVANISVGYAPIGLSISPDGSQAYVANSGSGTVSIIDTSANVVVGTITGGNGTFDVRVSPDGSRLYASNWYGGDVMVIDAASRKVLDRIQVTEWVGDYEGGINYMRVSPDGDRLYVSNAHDDEIMVINTNTGTVIKTISVGQYPRDIEVSANGSAIYVSLIGNRSICEIRMPGGNITERDMTPAVPMGLTYCSANRTAPVVKRINNTTVTPTVMPAATPEPIATPMPPASTRPGLLPGIIIRYAPIWPDTTQPITVPQLDLFPGLVIRHGTATITPAATPKPAASPTSVPANGPYYTGGNNNQGGLNGDTLVLGIAGVLIVVGIIGVIAYLYVSRMLRGGGDGEE